MNIEVDAARSARPVPMLPSGAIPPAFRTVDDLVKSYRASEDFTGLAKSTRRGYEQCLGRIGTWAGDAPVRAIDAKRIQVLKKSMARTPSFANSVVRVLRLLLEYGRREGWLMINPAQKPRLTEIDFTGKVWPKEAVIAFVAAADRLGKYSLGTAVMLNEWLGQREGDVLRLPRSIYRDGAITLRQGKTGAAVSLPVDMVPHLSARLAQELARQQQRLDTARAAGLSAVMATTIIVSEATGQPYKADHFRHAFAVVRAEMAADLRRAKGWVQREDGAWWHNEIEGRLGNIEPIERRARVVEEARRAASFTVEYLLPGRDQEDPDAFLLYAEDLWFMHLRHTAVTRNAEAGCEIPLIAAVTGHAPKSVAQILDRYMIRTRALAAEAFKKRLAKEGRDGLV